MTLTVAMEGGFASLVSFTIDYRFANASSFFTKSQYSWAIISMNLFSFQLSSYVNLSPNCKCCNMLLSNFSFMAKKEPWCLKNYFSKSFSFWLQYRLSSWIYLLKSLNSSSFSLFKYFPMETTSRSLMNLLWYHMPYKWYAYVLSISPTRILCGIKLNVRLGWSKYCRIKNCFSTNYVLYSWFSLQGIFMSLWSSGVNPTPFYLSLVLTSKLTLPRKFLSCYGFQIRRGW